MEDLFLVNVNEDNLSFDVTLVKDGVDVCKCRINSNKDKNVWTISSWYTKRGFMNKGYGKITLKRTVDEMVSKLGIPKGVEYIWNGSNEYVYEWLSRNFGALSKCPMAVQKYASDDDWESHIYILNTEKFLKYFNVI